MSSASSSARITAVRIGCWGHEFSRPNTNLHVHPSTDWLHTTDLGSASLRRGPPPGRPRSGSTARPRPRRPCAAAARLQRIEKVNDREQLMHVRLGAAECQQAASQSFVPAGTADASVLVPPPPPPPPPPPCCWRSSSSVRRTASLRSPCSLRYCSLPGSSASRLSTCACGGVTTERR